MELKNKIIKILPLTCLLVLGGIGVNFSSEKVEEGCFDKFNDGPTLNVRNEGFIGSDEEVGYSNVYSQYGIDAENNYWVRFAVAVKGTVSNLSFVRQSVEELGETEDVEKEVKTVYRAISSNGMATYYNPETGLSTDEADAGNYYWACYSIKIANENYYSSTISMSFKFDENVVAEKKISLNNLLGKENVYRFEAENANIVGNSGSGSKNDVGHNCFETSVYVSPKFSGSMCLKNNYHFISTYNFDSSVKDDFAKLKLFMSTRGAAALSTVFSIEVNDVALDLSNIMIPEIGEEYVPGSTYFNMVEVYVPVSLVSGANSIMISHGSSISTANLDYIEVVTSSEVSNWVDTPITNNGDYTIEVSKLPTHRSEGTLKVTCTHAEFGSADGSSSYSIPALTDTNFYKSTRDEENSSTNVEFTLGTKIVTFSYKDSYTLILNGATFEDGTTEKTFTVEEITAGEAEKIVTNAPEGYALVGWYDVDDDKYTANTTYEMKYEDDSIEAVYKPAKYVKSGEGHLDFGVQSSSSYFDNSKNVADYGNINTRQTGYIGNNRIGTILKFNCTAETSYFRIKTGYSREENIKYAQEYTIVNLGSEAISFDLNQVNSSVTKAGFEHKVTNLQPGEATTFTIQFTFTGTNGHLLSLFSFSAQYTNCSLGITSSIKIVG